MLISTIFTNTLEHFDCGELHPHCKGGIGSHNPIGIPAMICNSEHGGDFSVSDMNWNLDVLKRASFFNTLQGGRSWMYSRQSFMAIEALMKECGKSKRDSGEDGLFEDCRSCCFHRPYYTGQTCVFAVCPYSTQQISTRQKPKKVKVTVISSTIRGGIT